MRTKARIEIPRFSFLKTSIRDGRTVVDFASPLPSLFNYGHVPETCAADGQPEDVVVLGPSLPRGALVEVHIIGRVHFIDGNLRDDKWIASRDGRPASRIERLLLYLFFAVYAGFKRLKEAPTVCRFEGLSWNAS